MIILTPSFSKCSTIKIVPFHKKTKSHCLQIPLVCRALSKSLVFVILTDWKRALWVFKFLRFMNGRCFSGSRGTWYLAPALVMCGTITSISSCMGTWLFSHCREKKRDTLIQDTDHNQSLNIVGTFSLCRTVLYYNACERIRISYCTNQLMFKRLHETRRRNSHFNPNPPAPKFIHTRPPSGVGTSYSRLVVNTTSRVSGAYTVLENSPKKARALIG